MPRGSRQGAPYGNRNAAGHGAPKGNKNATKDGIYSTMMSKTLTDEEKSVVAEMRLDSKSILEEELKFLRVREFRLMNKIKEYEDLPEETMLITSAVDMREPDEDGNESARQKMISISQESLFQRIMKLQDSLNRVHGRIHIVINSLKAIEESEKRLELEKRRLDIMYMRATGTVEVDEVDE